MQLKSLEGRDGAVCAVLVTDADGNEKKLEADVVFVAYGFESLPLDGLAASGVALDDQGRIVTDGGCAASVSGVWAGGGDAVRGAGLAASAVADGRTAARAVCSRFLGV